MSVSYDPIQPVEPGDICCNCGLPAEDDCFKARRVRGHPLCGRPKCYDEQWSEWAGRRKACKCAKQEPAKARDFKERAAGE